MMLRALCVASCATTVLGTMSTPCGSPIANAVGLTMQYTASLPAQVAPTSTVYGAILTSYLNVVDCRYVQVENIEHNPAQIGQFVQKTTVPILTVYRVGCMPETTAITRRDLRGYEEEVTISAITTTFDSETSHLGRRNIPETPDSVKLLNSIQKAQDTPTNPYANLTVTEAQWIQSIQTTVWALDTVFSGMNLTQVCDDLQDASIFIELTQAGFDATEARDIVCFAAEYGIELSESLPGILKDLDWLAYAITSADKQAIEWVCNTLNLNELSFFGIDVNAISQALCGRSIGSTITTVTNSAASTTLKPSWSMSNNTANNTASLTSADSLSASNQMNSSTATGSANVPWNVSFTRTTFLSASPSVSLVSSTLMPAPSVNVYHKPMATPWHYANRRYLG